MTIQTSLVPHLIDALISKFSTMTVTGLTDSSGNPMQTLPVYDGYPGPNFEDAFVCVGGLPQPTARSRQTWMSLGQNMPGPAKDEKGEIYCMAMAAAGGDGWTGDGTGADAQKIARDNAYAIVAAAENALRSDLTLLGLGGAAAGVPLLGTGWCGVLAGDLRQTDESDSASGRYAVVDFTVDWFTRLRSI